MYTLWVTGKSAAHEKPVLTSSDLAKLLMIYMICLLHKMNKSFNILVARALSICHINSIFLQVV